MKDEPEIVKELKKAEELGILTTQMHESAVQNIFEDEEDDDFDTTVQVVEDNFEKNKNLNLEEIGNSYNTIFENYFVGITFADEKERIVAWNKYTEDLLKMNEKDLFLRNVRTLYPKEEWKKIREENIRKKGMKNKLETKILMKNGKTFDAEISLCVLRGEKGKIIGSVGLIQDITKLKTTEKKLIESREKYKTIFENSAVAITLTNENEEIISWNKYAEKLLNMDKEDLFLKPVKTLYPDDEWKKIRSNNVRKKGMQHHLETKIFRKNNEPLDVDISLSVLKNHNNEIIGSIGVIKDISERKKIEKKLKSEKDLLQSLLDNIPDSIYFKDKKSRFIKVNKAKAVHSKTTPEKMIGKSDLDFVERNKAIEIHKDDENVIETGKPIINKIEQIIDKKGNIHWISVTKIPRYDQDGKIIGTMGISRDVTQIKEADDEIKKSEKKYKKLFETAIDPIILLDEKGRFVDINNQVTKLLGYNKVELIGKQFDKVNILDKESISIAYENFNKRMSGKEVSPYEIKAVTKNGNVIPAEINASPLYEGKKVIGDLVILRDLRESHRRDRAEKELIQSENKFKDIFDSTSDFLLYLEKGIILDTNVSALKIMDLKKEDVIGRSLFNFKDFFSFYNVNQNDFINKVRNCEQVIDHECEIKNKDGTKYKFLFSCDQIKAKGDIVGVLLRGRDITQRHRAWEELVKLEEKYRVLAETSADGVITVDPLGRLTYVNPSFEKMCDRRKSQILATLFRDYLSDDSIYFFQQIFIDARKKDEKIENVELELVHLNGDIIPIEVNIAPLKKNGEFVGMVCTIRNITERRKIEEELKKSERLKTEFMNIAAHELKSPVTPIKGYLELIISDKEASNQVKDWAKVSLRNSERLLRLVNDILDVSRLDTDTMRFDMEKLNTVEILNEVAEDMRPAIEKKGLEFVVNIAKNLPNIMGDRYRLAQVLKNLMVNAIKFTDNGSITLNANKEKNHIYISVQDSGVGISKDELKKIFTKFYQAYTGDDRKNEGTGLGLFICKEIIQKHEGDIWAESEIRQGSTFIIKLPYLHKMVVDLKT